jgi:hypothetical protein
MGGDNGTNPLQYLCPKATGLRKRAGRRAWSCDVRKSTAVNAILERRARLDERVLESLLRELHEKPQISTESQSVTLARTTC